MLGLLRFLLPWAFAALWCGMAAAQPAALHLAATIELPGTTGRLDHLAYAADSKLLYVAALGADTVEVIDLNARRRLRRIAGAREPQGLAYAPGLGLFVASGQGDEVLRVEGEQVRTIATGLPDADNLRLDVAAGRLYAGYGKALAVLDARSGAVLQRLALPGHPEAFEVAGERIYVNVPSAGAVIVLDRVSGKVLSQWSVAPGRSNFAMALDAASRRLFVATRSPPELLAYATDTGAKVAVFPVCGDVDDLALDAGQHTLYAVCGDGHVLALDTHDPSRPQPRQSLESAPGARTGLWVPELRTLFVAAPARGGRNAAVLVYEVR